MPVDGTLIFDTKIDRSGIEKGSKLAKSDLEKLGAQVKDIFSSKNLTSGLAALGKQLGALAGPGAELLHLVLGVLHLLAKRGGPLSAAHHIFEISQTCAGFFCKGVERIETRVHHLQKVLSRQLAGCADLRKRK